MQYPRVYDVEAAARAIVPMVDDDTAIICLQNGVDATAIVARLHGQFNHAYAPYFPKDPPARTTVQAVLPREGLKVEIRVVAAMPGGPA